MWHSWWAFNFNELSIFCVELFIEERWEFLCVKVLISLCRERLVLNILSHTFSHHQKMDFGSGSIYSKNRFPAVSHNPLISPPHIQRQFYSPALLMQLVQTAVETWKPRAGLALSRLVNRPGQFSLISIFAIQPHRSEWAPLEIRLQAGEKLLTTFVDCSLSIAARAIRIKITMESIRKNESPIQDGVLK